MADTFTARKFTWLDQVLADKRVPGASFRLAYVLANRYWNRETDDAWPSQETLAADLSISVRAVRDLPGSLVQYGHLAVTEGGGKGNPIRYRPILKTELDVRQTRKSSSAYDKPQTRKNSSANKAPETRKSASAYEESKPGSGAHQTRKRTVAKPGSALPTTLLKDSIEDSIEGYARASTCDSFDAFWESCPLKKGKQTARKALERIRAKGIASPDTILAGMRRYAAERQGQDPRFTKHPATWLNAHCWLDEPVPQSQPINNSRSHRVGGMSAAEGVFAALGIGEHDNGE